ncbi:MAG: transglycosylase domain-containing protein [Actinomycetaceae bacterium]|nr:penicillin-binding protein [Arcanobacterium sp.]MDD7505201.1 transglycosylase domain-containing protein [Actinomycetaceae bacterium]
MAKSSTKKTRNKPVKKRGWNYPRAGLGPIHRWIPSWRFVLGTFITIIALAMGALFGLYVNTKIPAPDDFALAQTSTVYYSDAQTQMGTLQEVNRNAVELDAISLDVQHAVISSEDRTFYENNGVDLKGIARAFANNVTGGSTQGGSTLTQQYVERYYLGGATTLPGKVREAILAVKIDKEQTKDEILTNYLNTIYFGRGAYGIEAAAKAYFGVSAAELDLSQSALLAGIIPAPSAWDPAVDSDRAQQRFDRVLKLMQDDGWIDAEAAQAAVMPQTLDPSQQSNNFQGTTGYILQAVYDELAGAGFDKARVDQGGYEIVTTIDQKMQADAEQAIANLPDSRPSNNYVGLYSMNPTNGEVYAMYGGADYQQRQRNAATQDRAQAGSTFKMFGFAAALEQGIPINATFDGRADVWLPATQTRVTNSGNVNYGIVDMVQMVENSVNTAFVYMNEQVGPANTRAMAEKFGLAPDTPGLDDGPLNILGSTSVTAKEMARAYSVYANKGKLPVAHIVREVRDREGNVVFQGDTTTEQVISEDTAALGTYAMTKVIESGSGTGADIGRPAAGKTGTSTGPVSAWFVGFTPQVVTAVDMYQIGEGGAEDVLTGFGGLDVIYGGDFPATIWRDYMELAVAGMDAQEFPSVDRLLAELRQDRTNRMPRESEREETPEPEEPAPVEEPTDGGDTVAPENPEQTPPDGEAPPAQAPPAEGGAPSELQG